MGTHNKPIGGPIVCPFHGPHNQEVIMTNTKTLTSVQTKTLTRCSTKSAQIRYLTSQDWTRGQIAKKLNIRYQHVRNVQITPVKNPTK